MQYLLTGKQMKQADQYTIQTVGIPSMVLMERAALQIVASMEEEQLDLSNVLVVCGSGNNGGDGYAIARLLHLKGCCVSICFVGNDEKRTTENRAQEKITSYYQIPVKQEIDDTEYSVIIDAVFGNGLSRNVEGRYYQAIDSLNHKVGYKVAVDIPSGIHDDTGQVMGIAFRADLTLSLAFAKRGLVLESAADYVGKIKILDIGISSDPLYSMQDLTYCYNQEDFIAKFPKRKETSHKGAYGKLLLIVGNQDMPGAALLCARAAYTVGAGLVHIYTHTTNRQLIQKALPEAIVSTYDEYNQEQLQGLLQWANVVAIGCGLGQDDVAGKLVTETIRTVKVPCVVDADALNLLSKNRDLLQGKENLILTPHLKEMSRLLNVELQALQANKLRYLKAFTDAYPLTCVLKDARTFVSNKAEHTFLNLTGNCAMSKGGSGDVLTGIIAGILGQGASLYDASSLGVYLHGNCGDYARTQKGAYSVLAGDIIDSISAILKQIKGA